MKKYLLVLIIVAVLTVQVDISRRKHKQKQKQKQRQRQRQRQKQKSRHQLANVNSNRQIKTANNQILKMNNNQRMKINTNSKAKVVNTIQKTRLINVKKNTNQMVKVNNGQKMKTSAVQRKMKKKQNLVQIEEFKQNLLYQIGGKPQGNLHLNGNIPGDSNVNLMGCQMQEVGLCKFSVSYDPQHLKPMDPKCQKFFDRYVNFLDKEKDYEPMVNIQYKRIFSKSNLKMQKVSFHFELRQGQMGDKGIVYVTDRDGNAQKLCQGLKMMTRIEFDQEGNPKQSDEEGNVKQVDKQIVDKQVVNKQVVNKQVIDKQVVDKQVDEESQKSKQ